MIKYCFDCGRRFNKDEERRAYEFKMKISSEGAVFYCHRSCLRREIICDDCTLAKPKYYVGIEEKIKDEYPGIDKEEFLNMEKNQSLLRLIGAEHYPFGYWRFRIEFLKSLEEDD